VATAAPTIIPNIVTIFTVYFYYFKLRIVEGFHLFNLLAPAGECFPLCQFHFFSLLIYLLLSAPAKRLTAGEKLLVCDYHYSKIGFVTIEDLGQLRNHLLRPCERIKHVALGISAHCIGLPVPVTPSLYLKHFPSLLFFLSGIIIAYSGLLSKHVDRQLLELVGNTGK